MNNTETPTTTKHPFVMDYNRSIDMRCLNCDSTAYNLDVHTIPTPANWTDEDRETWGTPLSEMGR